MALHLPPYQPLPAPDPAIPLLEIPLRQLRPTQLCIGLAEIRSRINDFGRDSLRQRLEYLRAKPVPLVRSAAGDLWMMDRHHRLRGLMELDHDAIAFGYIAMESSASDRKAVLAELEQRGWLYLHDGRGHGPRAATELPDILLDLQDDPYRSLVWKLKKDKVIRSAPLIPFHEFRWGAWLRSRTLPPFHSLNLEPALPAARSLARSKAASHLAGWIGDQA
ncbi:MAG: ParB-like protein [Cyanobacteriota bacterium]